MVHTLILALLLISTVASLLNVIENFKIYQNQGTTNRSLEIAIFGGFILFYNLSLNPRITNGEPLTQKFCVGFTIFFLLGYSSYSLYRTFYTSYKNRLFQKRIKKWVGQAVEVEVYGINKSITGILQYDKEMDRYIVGEICFFISDIKRITLDDTNISYAKVMLKEECQNHKKGTNK